MGNNKKLVETICPNCSSEDISKIRKHVYECNDCGIQVGESEVVVSPHIIGTKSNKGEEIDDYEELVDKLLKD